MPQVRITTWSGPTLSRPKVAQAEHRLAEPGLVSYRVTGGFSDDAVALPQDLFVRRQLLDLDVDDDAALVDFLNAYGAVLRGMGRQTRALVPSADLRVLDADVERASRATDWKAKARRGGAPTFDSTRAIAADLRAMRALTWHWIHAQNDDDVRRAWVDEGLIPVPDKRQSWRTFVHHLNAGLANFSPRIDVDDIFVPGLPIDLYQGLCLQLLNAIEEDIPPLYCANETCRRPFIRQEGRAEFGLYRTKGVQYCSRACARAQAQREYRKRKGGVR